MVSGHLGIIRPLRRWARLGLVRAALLILSLLAAGPTRALEPGDLTLTVTPELNGNAAPYAREMVLLRIRGVYRTQILLEEILQPSLANFSWTQLGRDSWDKTRLPNGQVASLFERTVAIFPHRPGEFTLDPFIHRLTVNDDGQRKIVDVRSEPIALTVAAWTGATGGPDAKEPWWLPARDVSVTDSWDPDPETVRIGESTRRIVTLEVQGIVAEGLPPRPVMRTRGILTFAGPVRREMIITPQGPVARATYQWDVRPGVAEIIPLDAIAIPWFDTVSRTMREAEIPARQIGGGLPDREGGMRPPEPASWPTVAAAGLAAFGLGLALLGFGTGRARLRLDRGARRDLRRLAEGGDAPAFRARLAAAAQARPGLAALWRDDPDLAAGLDALDRAVYGAGGAPPPDLAALARGLARARRVPAPILADEPRLAALDGRAPSAG